jgi:hypothetical protein
MFLRRIFFSIFTLLFSQIVNAADYRPLSAEEFAATNDAFAASMYNPEFVAAAKSGSAQVMKNILIGNGASADMTLTAQGISAQSTSSDPGAVEHLNNSNICTRWQLFTWYAAYSSPGHPAGWYTMLVCTQYISEAGTVTYDPQI